MVIVVLVLLGLLVTAGAAGIAAWAVRRTLAPVENMAALADDWSERALDARFDEPATGDEFAHLARTLNLLLDRVAGALRSEQLLTSELAHELRTPLTGIRGEAELALMKADEGPVVEHLEEVVGLVDRMGTTIGALLALARGGEHPARGRPSRPWSTPCSWRIPVTTGVLSRRSEHPTAPFPWLRPPSWPPAPCPRWWTTPCATPRPRSP